VPSASLGDAGPQQREAANFDWEWSYSAPGLVIWLALILALVLPRTNRNLCILWIFVPLVIVNLLWLAFKQLSGMPSSSAYQFDTVFHSVAVGIAVLWLVASYFDRFGGFARFLMSFGTLVAVACLGILSYSPEFSIEAAVFLAMLVFLSITVLGATATAGKLCRRKYRPLRFMLWLALWTILGSLFTMSGFFIVGTLIMSSGLPGPSILAVILMLSLVGLICGLCLYVLNLPFMILGFANPFFRERFCACLGLQPIPSGPPSRIQTGEHPDTASSSNEELHA
jgi:MFS family permease